MLVTSVADTNHISRRVDDNDDDAVIALWRNNLENSMAAPLTLLSNSSQFFVSTTRAHSIRRHFSNTTVRFQPPNSIKMEGTSEISEEFKGKREAGVTGGKRVFVAGATGNTGKRIVEQLLAKGFTVKAGVRDIEKAKTTFSSNNTNPALQFVKADVTEGSDKLAEVIGNDSDAVICATGFRPSWDLLAPWKVDNFGTVNLVEACRKRGINRFILISSILVNGAAMGQLLNPAYIFLNVFGLTLVAKLQAEQFIRKSGINYTIVRPGGLRNDPPTGNIIMEPEDTLSSGSISRDQVAEVAVGALSLPQSHYKVVEIIASAEAPKRSLEELFDSVKQK